MAVVNLDPANDRAPYTAAVDVMELVSVPEVMDRLELGPNGGTPGATAPDRRSRIAKVLPGAIATDNLFTGLVYCMEYLEANLDWLRDKLAGLQGRASLAHAHSYTLG